MPRQARTIILISTFPTPSLPPVPRRCVRGRPILASFRQRLMPRFPIWSSFPTWRLRHDGRCGRSCWLVKGPSIVYQSSRWKQVRTVALDSSSMTSVVLTKILFAKWLGGARDYKPMAPDLDAMLGECDAALLIGDPALQVDRTRYFTLDLAEEWVARTGKSFVFAFWAIRKQALAGRNGTAIAEVFRKSRDHGLSPKKLEAIAQEWAPRLGLTVEFVRVYLTHNIHYYLDPPCLEGLELYYRLGAEVGALPCVPGLQFV